jgi:hypothetical protein
MLIIIIIIIKVTHFLRWHIALMFLKTIIVSISQHKNKAKCFCYERTTNIRLELEDTKGSVYKCNKVEKV